MKYLDTIAQINTSLLTLGDIIRSNRTKREFSSSLSVPGCPVSRPLRRELNRGFTDWFGRFRGTEHLVFHIQQCALPRHIATTTTSSLADCLQGPSASATTFPASRPKMRSLVLVMLAIGVSARPQDCEIFDDCPVEAPEKLCDEVFDACDDDQPVTRRTTSPTTRRTTTEDPEDFYTTLRQNDECFDNANEIDAARDKRARSVPLTTLNMHPEICFLPF